MDTRFNQNIRSHSSLWIAGVVLIMLIGVMLVANAFSRYTSAQLYQESCAQLSEITEQNYEKLSVVLDEQWRYTEALEALFAESAPASIEELARTLHGARLRLSPLDDSYRFVMLGSDNHFYTENGERRLWTAAAALDPKQHRQSMLVDLAEDEGNCMAFAYRLEQPITLRTDNGAVVLTHIILLKQLESLTGYFRCSAFNNQNVTFALQNNGVKMYADFAEDVLSQSIMYSTRCARSPSRTAAVWMPVWSSSTRPAQSARMSCITASPIFCASSGRRAIPGRCCSSWTPILSPSVQAICCAPSSMCSSSRCCS